MTDDEALDEAMAVGAAMRDATEVKMAMGDSLVIGRFVGHECPAVLERADFDLHRREESHSLLPEGGSASESCAMTRGGRRRSTRPGPAEPSRRKCACITEGITCSSALHRSGSRHRAGDPSLPLSLAVSV